MIQSKIIVTKFLAKRNINTFNVLTFIQMRTDENKLWILTNDYVKNLADCHEQRVEINSR